MVLYALPILGAAWLGTLPDPSQLSRVARVEEGDQPGEAGRTSYGTVKDGERESLDTQSPLNPPQHFLAAPGLPTSKLAQKIWDLEFVEMEEFLPTNRTLQALDQFTPESPQDGVLGALHQLQQQQGCRVADIMTWTRCFSHYVAAMAKKWAELVPYITTSASTRGASTSAQSWQIELEAQLSTHRGVVLNHVSNLFNQAPAGCPYGEDCIFAHRCSKCRQEDHGRRSCPLQDTGDERGSLLQPHL